MNKMADTVIKDMDKRQQNEDGKIKRYEMEKEMRERLEDERKLKSQKDQQREMARYLFK